MTLPFVANENNAATLFAINNAGDGTSIEGTNSTATSNIAAIRGIVTNTSPGGFSAAVRGINNGTGGLGVGVYGSQAGSGWAFTELLPPASVYMAMPPPVSAYMPIAPMVQGYRLPAITVRPPILPSSTTLMPTRP